MNNVVVKNMTKLFKKEILLYSFFDIRFQKPFRLVWGIYFVVLFLIWSLPLLLIMFPFNVYGAFLIFSVPIVGATFMSKPIWGGKTFFAWFITQIKYLFNPKIYYDGKPSKRLESYDIDYQISISRRKDYKKLLRAIKSGEV